MRTHQILVATVALAVVTALPHANAQGGNMQDTLQKVAPALANYSDERPLGEVWKRPGLSPRDRSIVTLAALVARNATIGLPVYLNRALDSGVKAAEISELITHLAFYAGLANAAAAAEVTKDVFTARQIRADELPQVNVALLPINETAEALWSSRCSPSRYSEPWLL
jgi:4-carboxymuconolactone decarboxylase